MPDPGSITFRKLHLADVPLMAAWLNTDHVKRWWRDSLHDTDAPLTHKDVRQKYLPTITGRTPTHAYLILDARLPIGFIKTYLIQSYPDYAHYVDVNEIAAGVDMFIGEIGHIGKGLAAPILRQFLRDHVFTRIDVASCITGPAVSNERAIHVYEQAGFRYLKTVSMPDEIEPEYLMRIGHTEALFGTSTNRESWDSVLQLFEIYQQGGHPHHKAYFESLNTLIRQVIASSRASLFRGGAQLGTLIISTKDRHGLGESDPCIRIYEAEAVAHFQLEYVDGSGKPVEQWSSDTDHLLSTLDPLLERLWGQTKPTRIKLTDL